MMRAILGSGGGGGASAAEDVSYDNSTSGMAATDVQAAIDEIFDRPHFNAREWGITYGDFNEPGVPPWTAIGSGAGAGLSNYNGFLNVAGRPGIARATTGSTNAGAAGARGEYQIIGNGCIFKASINLVDIATAGEDYKILVGYTNSITGADPTNGIYFTYVRGTSANWRCHTMASSTETVTATSVAVAEDAWVDFDIILNPARNSVAFYINGALVATHTTNIVTNTNFVNAQAKIVKTAGTTERFMYVDYISDSQRRSAS